MCRVILQNKPEPVEDWFGQGSRRLVGVAAPNEGVKKTMRKLLALSLVACLAVSMAFAFVGCAPKEATEEQPATEQPATEQPAQMPTDTTAAPADTTQPQQQ